MSTHSRKIINNNGPVQNPDSTETRADQSLHQTQGDSKAATISALLKHGGYSFSFTAPTAGKLVISWYQVPNGAHISNGKPKPVLVATGHANFSKASTRKVKAKLTAKGKRLLKHAKHLKLTARAHSRRSARKPMSPSRRSRSSAETPQSQRPFGAAHESLERYFGA